MPNRILKESICTSEKISLLSDFEFRLWAGLLTQVDDAGRGDARPAIIKGRVFPLRERVTVKDIESALHGLAAKGCVSLYNVGGKPYFWFPTWGEHQRIRDCKPKYPAPEDADNLSQTAAICGKSPQFAADCGLNPIQYESNPNTNPNPKSSNSAEHDSCSTLVVMLPLNDGTEYGITQGQYEEWVGLYPAVDVMQQLRSMRGWLLSNPQNRKTKRGINRFVTAWLSKNQDRAGRQLASGGGSNVFMDMLREEQDGAN